MLACSRLMDFEAPRSTSTAGAGELGDVVAVVAAVLVAAIAHRLPILIERH